MHSLLRLSVLVEDVLVEISNKGKGMEGKRGKEGKKVTLHSHP